MVGMSEGDASIFPRGHERLQGRRWPYITVAIIILNFGAFLAIHLRLETQSRELGQLKLHSVLLAANHPNVPMTAAQQQLVESFRQGREEAYQLLSSRVCLPVDAWDAEMREWNDTRAESEMARLGRQLEQLAWNSVVQRYVFQPSLRHPASYLTSGFLHGGWLHLLFNMWFLWLAGTILEDVWG